MNSTDEPLAEQVPPEVRRRRRRRLVIAAGVFVLSLMAFFLPPLINLGKYKRSITASMSTALGRPVYVGDMQLQLLPMPGIAMSNVTVAEDPAFGYEPALHATSVVVWLRLTSLWRGRLEVSRISLDDASLNLVRSDNGQWNIGSILLRASRSHNEPTAQRRPGANPRFPYIEASDSRINFKRGLEKEPFSLDNAEFSMWQAGGPQWRLRLKAQPIRTDRVQHLSDAGEVTVEGALGRASDLGSMPVNLHADWSGAQLGEASMLLAGFDSGWRGDLDATAAVQGTLGALQLKSRLRIAALRRQEFQPVHAMDVDTRCQASYLHVQEQLGNITCFWPVDAGHLLLTGNAIFAGPPQADLHLELNQIPASFPVALLGLMRFHAGNLSATGAMNGSFQLQLGSSRSLSGGATATDVSLSWPGGTLSLPALHLDAAASQLSNSRQKHRPSSPQPIALDLQPFDLPFGEPNPLVVSARIAYPGFEIHLAGSASVARLMAAAGRFGWMENAFTVATPHGHAQLNTTTQGTWLGPLSQGTGMGTTGTMRIQDAVLQPPFLHGPLQVPSADINLSPGQVAWRNVALRFAGLSMRGSIQYPAECDQPTPCAASFTLQPGPLNAATLEAAMEGKRPGFFGRILADTLGGNAPAPWPPLHGQIQTPSLQMGKLTLHNVSATIQADGKTLTIESLDGSALGGMIHASGAMSLQSGTPQWTLSTSITGAKPSQAVTLFHEDWGKGLIDAQAKLSLAGWNSSALASSAGGSFQFTWQKGTIPGAPGSLAHFDRWTAQGTIANRALTISGGGIARARHTEPVRGTIGFDRRLNLTMQTRKGPVRVDGTLAAPVVAPH